MTINNLGNIIVNTGTDCACSGSRLGDIEHTPERCGKRRPQDDHRCFDYAVPYESDGALGHGWECGRCGKFLQAG